MSRHNGRIYSPVSADTEDPFVVGHRKAEVVEEFRNFIDNVSPDDFAS